MLLTALTFVIILSILVFVHELGHFLMARFIGVRVEEFGFGLPPRAFGIKYKGTIYSINWLPIGGFVRLAGEDDDHQPVANPTKEQKKFFWARSGKERSAILLAGVTMNFVLAVGITAYLLNSHGAMQPTGKVFVQRVAPGSPADDVGLQENDIVKSLTLTEDDGSARVVPVHTPAELIEATKQSLGEEVIVTYVRNGQEATASVVPRVNPPEGEGSIGIAITDLQEVRYPFPAALTEAFRINVDRAKEMVLAIGGALYKLVTLRPSAEDVAGPIGIAQVTGEAVKFGFFAVLEFMSILSLNLAVLNILPIPALDGGRLLFVIIEKIMGRRVAPTFERNAHQWGMLFLFGLLFLISINDILRLTRGL